MGWFFQASLRRSDHANLELPGHPFFMGTQAHPELTSRPLRRSRCFGSCCAAIKRRYAEKNPPSPEEAVRTVCQCGNPGG
jgi:CTP synthase (UTP-ammonia lyase)